MSAAPGNIGWRVASISERDALAVGRQEVGQYVQVLEGSGLLYQAIKAGTGSSCWGEASDFSTLTAAEVDNDSGITGDKVDDALDALAPTARIYGGQLIPITTGLLLSSGRAYWLYMGYFPKSVTVSRLRIHVVTGGSGTQTADWALASSPAAPNRANQTLTKIAGASFAPDLTGTGILSSATLTTVIPAGTHLWAGFRTAMATTQPTLLALANDLEQGRILSTAAAGALTGAGPWTGVVATHALTAQGPMLSVTLD